jgi:D-serine dehydratase
MPISSLEKALAKFASPASPSDVAALSWNLLHEDLNLPAAVLSKTNLLHNAAWMQQFIAAYGVQLAPHGKTTMTPALFRLQLRTGAWGITLATAQQTAVAYEHGVRRVLLANQLVGKQNMSLIARLLADPEFEFFCLVDSVALVEQLAAFFGEKNLRLNVLLELGIEGGRTGVRNEEQAQAVLDAIAAHRDSIALCGVEIYEGLLDNEESIRTYCQRAVTVTNRLLEKHRFDREKPILTGAGSAWYDIVAEEFSSAGLGGKAEIVLRPGCYLTHDVGVYRVSQQNILERNPIAKKMHSSLKPALQVWAYVQSIPEPEKAIIAMGKRDAAFDAGLPVPALHYRAGSVAPQPASSKWEVTKMMDQHAFMKIAAGDDLRVGDMLAFDISHPCLTFDKWRWLAVVDDSYQIVDLMQTFF